MEERARVIPCRVQGPVRCRRCARFFTKRTRVIPFRVQVFQQFARCRKKELLRVAHERPSPSLFLCSLTHFHLEIEIDTTDIQVFWQMGVDAFKQTSVRAPALGDLPGSAGRPRIGCSSLALMHEAVCGKLSIKDGMLKPEADAVTGTEWRRTEPPTIRHRKSKLQIEFEMSRHKPVPPKMKRND